MNEKMNKYISMDTMVVKLPTNDSKIDTMKMIRKTGWVSMTCAPFIFSCRLRSNNRSIASNDLITSTITKRWSYIIFWS